MYGSLSLGDFDPDSSDVDLVFVTAGDLSADRLAALRDMHREIASSGLPYAKKLEVSYIPRAALRRYDPQNALHPSIGVDWEFGIGHHGSTWIVERHIMREHGLVVWGLPPEQLIDPVPKAELQAAVCAVLKDFWQRQLTESASASAWLQPRDYQAFAVLTMCRALYTLSQGDVVSKPQAAAWAMEALDPGWRPLIERALLWRHQHERDDLGETLAFIRFAVARAAEVCR